MPRKSFHRLCVRKRKIYSGNEEILKSEETCKAKNAKKDVDIESERIESSETDIEELLWLWFLSTVDLERITEANLISNAKEFIQKLGCRSFKVTPAWLKAFQRKHNIGSDGNGGLIMLPDKKSTSNDTHEIIDKKEYSSFTEEIKNEAVKKQENVTKFEEFFSDRLSNINSDDDNADIVCDLYTSSSNTEEVDHYSEKNKILQKLDRRQLSTCSRNLKDVINMFVDDEFFTLIAAESNKYFASNSEKHRIFNSEEWTDITVPELKRWFGLGIIMMICTKPNISEYWSSDPINEMPIFPQIMSYDRFVQIFSSLHFSDNNNNMDKNITRLCKVEKIVDYFRKKFETAYKLKYDTTSVYEIISWRPSVDSKQCKRGILIELLKENETGYIRNITIHPNYDHMDSAFAKRKAILNCKRQMNRFILYKKSKKWSNKVVFHMLNCALLNAFYAYKGLNIVRVKGNFTFNNFLREIVELWLNIK